LVLKLICCYQVRVETWSSRVSAWVASERAVWIQHGGRVSATVQWRVYQHPRQQTVSCQIRHPADWWYDEQRPGDDSASRNRLLITVLL